MNRKVSILIPTFNQGLYISSAIQSAIQQTYKNIEILISDDASKDGTERIVKKYLDDKRVKYFRNQSNLGRVKNYRKALYELATGDWVLNLDGDDYLYDKDFIKTAVSLIQQYEDVILVGGGCIYKNLDDGYEAVVVPTKKDIEYIEGKELFLSWFKRPLAHLSVLYNREAAIRIGFYNKDIISSDWESILRLLLEGKVILINKIAGVWRMHKKNISTRADIKELCRNSIYITSPYEYAISKGIKTVVLNYWRGRMFRQYIDTSLLNISYSGRTDLFVEFYRFIKENHPFAKKYFFYPLNLFVMLSSKTPFLLDLARKTKWKIMNRIK